MFGRIPKIRPILNPSVISRPFLTPNQKEVMTGAAIVGVGFPAAAGLFFYGLGAKDAYDKLKKKPDASEKNTLEKFVVYCSNKGKQHVESGFKLYDARKNSSDHSSSQTESKQENKSMVRESPAESCEKAALMFRS